MTKLSVYFHTLKYLKFAQIYHRILKRFNHPKAQLIIGKRAGICGEWVTQELYCQKIFNETDVKFLNRKGAVKSPDDWNSNKAEKLWLYNLHYFDDLNSFGSQSRKALQKFWIGKWIDENPAINRGNGWEAYTLSLRIVNWIKAFLSGLETEEKTLNSLAQQADFLSQDLEKHLLGNHYFVNLKALLFAGCFFQGKEANRWLLVGLNDYEKELKEQLLEDGGSFELTPMYHAIMLADLLDLFNLFNTFPFRVPKSVANLTSQAIMKMLGWLQMMCLGDDRISFFNDSAFGIAPENKILREYSSKLGISTNEIDLPEETLVVHDLKHSGYVSIKTADMSLIADLAHVGPSYIPGHAHADSLAFELSLGKSRVFVNSGTSVYGTSNERLRQRGTSAHNTVEINSKNSSEVWSGFRVARRAEISNRKVGNVAPTQSVEFSASHDGYRKQGIYCTHHRAWSISLNSCEIKDFLQGAFDSAVGNLHLHPGIKVIFCDSKKCILNSGEHKIELDIVGADLVLNDSTWHPEFGVVIASKKLILHYKQPRVAFRISWNTL